VLQQVLLYLLLHVFQVKLHFLDLLVHKLDFAHEFALDPLEAPLGLVELVLVADGEDVEFGGKRVAGERGPGLFCVFAISEIILQKHLIGAGIYVLALCEQAALDRLQLLDFLLLGLDLEDDLLVLLLDLVEVGHQLGVLLDALEDLIVLAGHVLFVALGGLEEGLLEVQDLLGEFVDALGLRELFYLFVLVDVFLGRGGVTW